jgi:hypothetical protein
MKAERERMLTIHTWVRYCRQQQELQRIIYRGPGFLAIV